MEEKHNNNYSADNTDYINVLGARVHNLKNVDVRMPRNALNVVTGLSGSGKSSLAFDTIYAEGQRRYIETLTSYARQFIGNLERPDVDKITGLSPVIAIDQKSVNKNPRSTVGTITEIYDFLRLLFARIGVARSYITGEKMVKYSDDKIIKLICEHHHGKNIYILAPVVTGRKGHYKELFEQIRKKGFINVRVDEEIKEITYGYKLDRYKTHSIEIVIDKLTVNDKMGNRLKSSVQTAMKHGKGIMMILEQGSRDARYYSRKLMCPTSGISYNEPAPHSFSFNSPRGACQHCSGLGIINKFDKKKIIPHKSKSIKQGAVEPLGEYRNTLIFWQIEAVLDKYGFTINTPVKEIPDEVLNILMYGSDDIIKLKKTPLGSLSNYKLSFQGIVNYMSSQDTKGFSSKADRWLQQYIKPVKCPDCNGDRLKKESLHFFVNDKNIAQLTNMGLIDLHQWFSSLENDLSDRDKKIGHEVVKEIKDRLGFLLAVGLGYLALDRPARSLSGGESQRIRLATQVGSELVNVLYILDEPSIGLHQRDNRRLIDSLKKLRDAGNSVVVVEHDRDMILSADYVVDLGPYAGNRGGEVVMQGTPDEIKQGHSLTADYLSYKKDIHVPAKRRKGNGKIIILEGATGNNLKNIKVAFPLGCFICVTGVSGSGKSTLVNETLYPILSKHFYRALKDPLPYQDIKGLEHIDKVIEVNQNPLGRTPRSNPVTYTGIFTEIRKLFEQVPEAKINGYNASRFSFNVKGGRCEECKGAGVQTIEMNFLPDVYIECRKCNGKRYNRETLRIHYKGKSISDVLEMTINHAVDFFEPVPSIYRKLKALQGVGMGYIRLGQPSTTLSGGEAQRVKLATELMKKDTGKTLYIMDEPTTGMHFEDIKVLLNVLEKLIDKGNTVIMIEHNMDVIKTADHIIDIGKEGGDKGGQLIACGTPEKIMKDMNSYTGKALKTELKMKAP